VSLIDSDKANGHPPAARLLRALNIVVCIAALAYFLSFLALINAQVSWILVAWHLFVQVLIVVPQIFALLAFLVLEARSTQSTKHHVIILINVIAFSLVGYWWSTTLMSL
jgi:hypothetical protein